MGSLGKTSKSDAHIKLSYLQNSVTQKAIIKIEQNYNRISNYMNEN